MCCGPPAPRSRPRYRVGEIVHLAGVDVLACAGLFGRAHDLWRTSTRMFAHAIALRPTKAFRDWSLKFGAGCLQCDNDTTKHLGVRFPCDPRNVSTVGGEVYTLVDKCIIGVVGFALSMRQGLSPRLGRWLWSYSFCEVCFPILGLPRDQGTDDLN